VSTDCKPYANIFNFCFDDDIVTLIPPALPGWDYGKHGVTISCIAADIYAEDAYFRTFVNGYTTAYGIGKPTFDSHAAENFINMLYILAPSIDDYYNKLQPDLEPILGAEATMSDFMSQVIAGAMTGSIQLDIAQAFSRLPESNTFVSLFKSMFGNSPMPSLSVASAHMPQVYYVAVVTGAFGK
jgi:hypothetical protein